MDIYLVLAIIVLGILLVVLEILVIPGTTVVGVIGGVLMGTGVVLAYSTQDDTMTGHFVLAGTSVATVILLYWSYKVLKSKKYSLYDVIDGKVNELEPGLINVGDEGLTLSALRPEGKARFKDKTFAVFSQGEMIDVNVSITVLKINGNKIIVKPLTN